MLDTLMVLLMKGFRAPFLRALMAFLFLCTGIGALLLLITLSGVRWPGMAATASSVTTTSQGPISAPAPTAPIPHILHNPCVASPTASTTPSAPRSQNKGHNATGVQQPGYNYPPPASTDLMPINPIDGAIPGREPSVIRSILDPLLSKPLFRGFSAKTPQASCLSNSLATPTSKNVLSTFGSFLWPLLGTVGLLMICGLGLFVTGQRRKR